MSDTNQSPSSPNSIPANSAALSPEAQSSKPENVTNQDPQAQYLLLAGQVEGLEKYKKKIESAVKFLVFLGITVPFVLGWLLKSYKEISDQSGKIEDHLRALQGQVDTLEKSIKTHSAEIEGQVEAAKADLKLYAEVTGRDTFNKILGAQPFIAGTTAPFKDHPTSTGISANDYILLITGFDARGGDINEDDAGDPIRVYPVIINGVWYVEADFRSHHDHESWKVNYMAVRKSLVTGEYAPMR